jgi:4-carboxymuconolactone decarboxylase
VNDDRYRRGKQVRESVLGPVHAARTANSRTPFNADFQDFLMEYAWGAIWARPGLDRKTRSMLNLAMLTALNRPHEIKLHVRGAINNGVTVEEIKEVLIHATVYCGIPAGLDSFKAANEVLKEMGAFAKK